ncbi:MAG: PD40 domain-containing protein [Bacteroidia bacterium]|nr:PD40 domain-containing protein [Bacteroidia bacterium]
MKFLILIPFLLLFTANQAISQQDESSTVIHYPEEVHLKNIKQLTFGGDNAEAYFSFDNRKIVFQSNYKEWGNACDQIFMTDLERADLSVKMPKRISTGEGRTTCSFFMPGNKSILYASTHMAEAACPPVPPRRADKKYVWPIYQSYDIFVADLDVKIINQLTNHSGYDAEATVSPVGDKIVFTSDRSGDLELYTMNLDGSAVKQITNQLGYDGGAFFSPDGKMLVFRASRPKTDEEIKEYKELLAENLVMPTRMEIFVCNNDGTNLRQVTNLGGANWAPYFTPDGKRIVFSSNHKTKGFQFNIFMINLDGSGLRQITFDKTFDSFPMFSYNGKKFIWSSNRNNNGTHDTNIFIADWEE